MTEKEKQVLVEKFIDNRFDIENFKEFITRVLNVTVKNSTPSTAIWKEYKEYIEEYQVLSDYKDLDNKRVLIVATKIKEEKDPTRARVKQREVIAKMLREWNADSALVAFYNENSSIWRVSLVKLEYSFTMAGIKENLTPAKRFSYVVGEGEASLTVKKQFSTLAKIEESVALSKLEELFQLEKVTNDFFDEYKKKYLDLKEYLEKNEQFMSEAKKQNTENPEAFSEGFAKKLMGQIAFLYFLQKKGWLGVKIVPQSLSSSEYDIVYNRALPEEKVVLENVYSMVDESTYKLKGKVFELNVTDSNNLANAFKNLLEYDKTWGTGDKKFLRTLFIRHLEINMKSSKDKNFFDDYLEHLFYDALNLDRGGNQYFKTFNCKIPFLNGGLFEPYDNYDWKNTDFDIPDTIFSNEKKEGILDIFDRYNFTICENEPYETEVAVDPEMLGKVFENLLDVKDRKSKGAFYTPREIVHYMCKESLINYLTNEIPELQREDIDALIQIGEFTKEYDEHLYEKDYVEAIKNDTTTENILWGMPKFIMKNAERIDAALRDVRVADPAVGSGAFPLGMLNEIVKARSVLTYYIVLKDAVLLTKEHLNDYWSLKHKINLLRSHYNLKIQTIENSLYGVDIEPSAIDIAKLRLWLSIVVDTENKDIRPLPNLDFNFMVGNSLLEEFDGIKLFDEKLLDKNNTKLKKDILMGFQLGMFGGIENTQASMMDSISKLHRNFFAERDTTKKKEIKQKIEDIEWQLITVTLRASGNEDKIKELEKLQKQKRKPYFLWKLEFAKVFQEKGGFDIVIGNPPYVGEKGNKDIFRPISESSLGKRFYQGRVDLFYFFFHLGIDMLRENGNLGFITTNYYLTADGAKKLREDFKERTNLIKLINFNEIIIFDTAKGQHNLITLLNKSLEKNKELKVIMCDSKSKLVLNDLHDIFAEKSNKVTYHQIKQSEIYDGEKNYIRIEDDKISRILNKIKGMSKPLNTYFSVKQGIVSGADKFTESHREKYDLGYEKGQGIFVLTNEELSDLKLNSDEKKIIKPFFKNSDIDKYINSESSKLNIIYISKNVDIDCYPNIKKHLEKYKKILMNKRETQTGKLPWYSLHWGREENIFVNNKIIAPQRSKKNTFSYNEINWFSSADVYYITGKENVISLKYILGILNSKLYYCWFYKFGKRKGEMLELYATPLEEAPIKIISLVEQNKIIEFVDNIILCKKERKNSEKIELILDEVIYDLYELTEKEKNEIRNF